MGKSYSEKLQDPRWQKKRLKIMERDRFACLECGDTRSTLNVHHGCYLPGRDPWDYDDRLLHTLCEQCHEYTQRAMAEVHEMLGAMRLEELRPAALLLAASGLCRLEPSAPIKPEPKPDSEVLEILESQIESHKRYGDPGDQHQASLFKNRCQLAAAIRRDMEQGR